MTERQFLAYSSGLLPAPRAAEAQQVGRAWRIGYLAQGSARQPASTRYWQRCGKGSAISAGLKARPSPSRPGTPRGRPICSAYGVNFPDMNRHAASFVDKIFGGTKPADLPDEQQAKFELGINPKTVLGLTIPPSVLARADRITE